MYIYQKQCEIMQKIKFEQLNRPILLISHWFSVLEVQNGPSYKYKQSEVLGHLQTDS